MNTRSKVIVDEWFGRALVFLLNLLARLLGSILRINHSFDRAPKRIVVCKFLGMGSIIQSTPLLRTLRLNHPEAKICFVTSIANESLLRNISIVDEIKIVDDRGIFSILTSTFSLIFYFWKSRVDWYIDLETYSYYSTAIATLSCARNRLGFYRVERNIRMGVHTHMMFFNQRAPISQSYLQMARLAGCKKIETELNQFNVNEELRGIVRKKLETAHSVKLNEYVVVNPNASDLRIERRWPKVSMISLLEKMTSEFPDSYFILIGASNERAWVNSIHEKLSESARRRVLNSAGELSLAELFALIDGASLMITNDTGPMHISFALKKRTVCLFGPASPAQYGQHPFAAGLYANVYCSPCVHDFIKPPCKGDNQCMKQISVDMVFGLVAVILRDPSGTIEVKTHEMEFLKEDKSGSLGIVSRN